MASIVKNQNLPPLPACELSVSYSETTRKTHRFQIDNHCHDCCEIYVNVTGDVSFMVEETLYPVSHGDAVITKPWEHHHCVYRSDRPHKHYWLLFSAENEALYPHFFDREPGKRNLISLPAEQKEALVVLCQSLLENEENALSRYADFFAMQRLLAYGAAHSHGKASALPEELAAMLAYAADAAPGELCAASLAEAGHVSLSTAERLFREYIGLTPLKYITEKRFDKARALLKSGKNVTEAALESGFCDSSYFILQFRKRYGITPNAFRRQP